MKVTLRAFVCCLMLSIPAVGAAGTIVDTGTPIGGPNYSLSVGQYFGGEFTITDSYLITNVSGYFQTSSGTIWISLHDDGGNVPGLVIDHRKMPIGVFGDVDLAWHGSDFNFVLARGTYWVSFRPEVGTSGIMPGTAPNPMNEYAQGSLLLGVPTWHDFGADNRDFLGVGMRVSGEKIIASVDDSTSTWSLLIGGALLLTAAHKRWV